MDRLWAFVIGQAFAAEIDQLVLAGLHAILQHNERGNFFAVELIGNANRSGGRNGGMLIEDFVDFAWVDILAAANDHVTLTIDDEKESFPVPISNVTRMEPAVAKSARRCFRLLEITLQNVFPAQYNFTKLPVRN